MKLKSIICYCVDPSCTEYNLAKYMKVIIPPYIPFPTILEDIRKCEECHSVMLYFEEPELTPDDSGLFWE